MLTRFTNIIQSITHSQTENERNLSLAGICNASRHANLSIEMFSDLLFINRNSTTFGSNNPFYVFGGSLDAVANILMIYRATHMPLQMLVTLNKFNYHDYIYFHPF